VTQIEFTVSTGPRCSWRRVEKADNAFGLAVSPNSSRVAATK
jgi:hypothetical protein